MALQFSVGLDAFRRQDCARAKSVFQHILADFPEDISSLIVGEEFQAQSDEVFISAQVLQKEYI